MENEESFGSRFHGQKLKIIHEMTDSSMRKISEMPDLQSSVSACGQHWYNIDEYKMKTKTKSEQTPPRNTINEDWVIESNIIYYC